MPMYEYRCTLCGTRFERLRPSTQRDVAPSCPDCGGPSRRLLSVFAAFSTGAGGESRAIAGTGGCTGCAGGACSACSHGS
jgi:putative FmdB family regulatory protein